MRILDYIICSLLFSWVATAAAAEKCYVVTTPHTYASLATEFVEEVTKSKISKDGGIEFRDNSGGFRVVVAEMDIARKSTMKSGFECVSADALAALVNYTLSRVDDDVMDTGWKNWRTKWLPVLPSNVQNDLRQCYGLHLGTSLTKLACADAFIGVTEYIEHNPTSLDRIKGLKNFQATLLDRGCFHSRRPFFCAAVMTKYQDGEKSWEKTLYRMAKNALSEN